MDNNERKLSSEELEQLLKEVENEPKVQVLKDEQKPRKKKTNIRFDMIVAGIVAVVLLGCLILIAGNLFGCFNKNGNDQQTKVANALQDEKYPEISDVVKHYLEAFLIKDAAKRREELAHYVDNMGDINESNIKFNDYITAYRDIECYTKDGLNDNTYVVYAYYQIRLKNIATTVPGITRLYVVRDVNTGDVFIHNGADQETIDYMNKLDKDKDVQNLYKDVDKEFQEALESDKYLKAFFDKLKASSTTKPAATTAKPVATTAKPAATTAKPAATTAKPAATTAKPAATTAKPAATKKN